MADKNKPEILVLDASRGGVRVALACAVAVALLFGWFSIRWQLGNMLAEHTTPTDEGAGDLAAAAVDFAPRDPLANWLLFNTETSASAPKDGLETVVRLAPYDFRWWIELGRAREQAGDSAAAENALKRAVELAPEYTFPHWQLGNFYLRRDRADDAFRELTQAAQSNSLYREQVFSVAWDYFDRDASKVERIAAGAPEMRADLAKFYAAKNLPQDSLRVWNSLSDEEKQANVSTARAVAQSLYEKRLYRAAIEFVRQSEIEPDARFETIENGGFERPIGNFKDAYFGWRISPQERFDVKIDSTQKREGAKSLRVSFDGFSQGQLSNIYQTVTVEPRARYRLTFWLKTENLKTGGAPQLEIYDIADNKIIAGSAPFPVGTNDWQQLKIEFAAPESAEAVGLRTTRAYCGENCPVVGAFWYDDFRLERVK